MALPDLLRKPREYNRAESSLTMQPPEELYKNLGKQATDPNGATTHAAKEGSSDS